MLCLMLSGYWNLDFMIKWSGLSFGLNHYETLSFIAIYKTTYNIVFVNLLVLFENSVGLVCNTFLYLTSQNRKFMGWLLHLCKPYKGDKYKYKIRITWWDIMVQFMCGFLDFQKACLCFLPLDIACVAVPIYVSYS